MASKAPCDACAERAAGAIGHYRFGCLRCMAHDYLQLPNTRLQLEQTRRWKASLPAGELAELRRLIAEERECLTA